MLTQRLCGRATAVAVGLALALCSVGLAEAKKGKGGDPGLACAAAKDQAAGQYCAQVLKAWSRFDRNGKADNRDAAIAEAGNELANAWTEAESNASEAGVDCKGAFIASSTAGAFIDSASGALVEAVNDGLDLDRKRDAKCGSKIVKAAADKCQALLGAESEYLRTRSTPDAAARRDDAIAKVRARFAKAFGKGDCSTTATEEDIEGRVDAISDRISRDVLSSPDAGTGPYVTITPGDTEYQGRTFHPVCMNGSPYAFFARRGTVNKLVMY